MKQENAGTAPRTRRVFVAGRLTKRQNPRPCHAGSHVGPLLNTAVYNRAGGPWSGCGECEKCGSTVHKSQLRPRAA
jgi:hypothetical protein